MNYKDHTIEIVQDSDPFNPRQDYDHLGTLCAYHRRYDLGDKDQPSMEEAREIAQSDDYISLNVFMYDHSGITISCSSFSCPWDSGQLGIIFVSKEKIRKEFGWKLITAKRRKQIEQYLINEVKEFDQYLTGDVWGYVVKDNENEEKESCWGFFGHDYCLEEAKSVVDHLFSKRFQELPQHVAE